MSVTSTRFACRILKVPNKKQSNDIIELYRYQGWWKAVDDNQHNLLQRIISGSHFFVIAEQNDHVVGIGRAISDGVSDGYIQDLTVHHQYRMRGIGQQILRTLINHLIQNGISWIGLIAEPGSFDFYKRNGFNIMPDATPMLLLNNAQF